MEPLVRISYGYATHEHAESPMRAMSIVGQALDIDRRRHSVKLNVGTGSWARKTTDFLL
jgi:hypothetical protein